MIVPFPNCTTATLPDEMTLAEAALQAAASHLRLVIDRDGEVKLTPILLPGMQPYNFVVDKQMVPA